MKPAAHHPFEASEPLQRQHAQVLSRLEGADPRVGLQCRLQVRQRVLEQIQERLALDPENVHQNFIFELHQQAYHDLLAELKQLQLESSARYGDLKGLVDHYLEDWEEDPAEAQDPDKEAQQAQLRHQQKTWQEMVDKVRERLRKRPGDPLLMRLLGEHQARLLSLQEQSRQLKGAEPEPELVLEKLERQQTDSVPTEAELVASAPQADLPEDPVIAESLTKRLQLEREIEILTGMIEKTQQRLELKPGLNHLKDLIARHQQRIDELQQELRNL